MTIKGSQIRSHNSHRHTDNGHADNRGAIDIDIDDHHHDHDRANDLDHLRRAVTSKRR